MAVDQVMNLPAEERAELVTAVFDSVDTLEDTSDEELFDLALERDQEIENGDVRAIARLPATEQGKVVEFVRHLPNTETIAAINEPLEAGRSFKSAAKLFAAIDDEEGC
jgi:hypothetical protein